MKTVHSTTSLLHASALAFAFAVTARASGVAALGDVSCGVYHNTATTGIPVSTNNYLWMCWHPENVSLHDVPWWNWLELIDTNASPAPEAAVVSGQLKWAARCAKQILDGACASAGGAGSEINAMISSFSSWPNDEAVTTVDFLAVVRPIAIRVRDLYVDTMVQSIPPYPNPQYYPDAPQSLVPLQYLKFAFCFDPLYDWDEDGLPDWWERYWFSLGWHDTTPIHPDDDSDYDGLSNLEELYAATTPVDRDTDGDGLIDGVDPRPEYANWWFDANGNGLSDDFERHWFGGLNASLTPDTPLGDGFTLGMKMAAGLCPTSPVPETVYPADGLSALLLVPRFGVSTNAGVAVWTRTFDLDGEEAWEHYFVSSSPNPVSNGGDDDCGAWALDGFSLEWEVSGEMPVSASASPASSPLRIPIAPASGPPGGPRQLTLRLRTTRSGVTACPTPLYLLSYTPALEFPDLPSGVSGDALVSAATAGESVAFSVDWSAQPGPIDPPVDGSDESFFERFGASSISLTRHPETGLIEGGVLYDVPVGFFEIPFVAPPSSPPLRSILPLPPPARRLVLAILSPRLTFGTGHGPDAAGLVWDGASYVRSSDYPLDDESLWRAFHCDETGRFVCGCTPVLDLGIPDEYVPLFLTNVVVATDDGRETATATVHMDGELLWTGTAVHLRYSIQLVEANDACGCETCEMDGPSSGSVRFRISLGSPRAGQVSGFVWFRSDMGFSVAPSSFELLARPDAAVADTTASGVRTIACSDARGRTVAISAIENGVTIAVTTTATGAPDHSWTIVNENGNASRIRFVRTSRAGNVQSDETYVCAGDAWSVSDNIAGTTETVLRDDALDFSPWPTGAVERILADASGNELVHTVSLSRRFGSGPAAILRETERREAVGTPFEKTFLATWWEDGGARAGLPRLLSGDARAWSWTDWDAKGRPILVFDQRDGAPCPDDGTWWTLDVRPSVRAFATVHSYDRISPDDSMDPEDDATPRTTSRYVVDGSSKTLISRTWTEIVRGTTAGRPSVSVRTERAASQAAAFGAPGNAVSVSVSVDPDAAGVPLLLRGRPLSYTDEDGVTTTYEYAFGSWNPATRTFASASGASHLRTRVFTTTPDAPNGVPLVSTISETVEDATHGNEVWSATRVLLADGSLSEPFDWESRVYDDQDRLRSTLYADGSSSTNAYSCCRLLFTVDRNGMKRERLADTGTDHLRHAWLDVSFSALPHNVTALGDYAEPLAYAYHRPYSFRAVESLFDPLGREIRRRTLATEPNRASAIATLRASNRAWESVETNFYPFGTSDSRFRIDARGLRTERNVYHYGTAEETWTETYDGTNLLDRAVACSTRGGSSESYRSWDGVWTDTLTFSRYGSDGCRTDYSVTTASDSPAVTNSVAVHDFLGRTARVVTPLSDSTYAYDGPASRVSSVSDAASGLSSSTLYNALREPVGSLGSDGIASFSSTRYEQDASNVWWRVSENREAAAGATNLLSTVRERLTGLSDALRSEIVSIPAGGPVSVATVSFDPATLVSVETNLVEGLAPLVRRSKFGRVFETLDRDGVVHRSFFDPYGRPYLTGDLLPGGTFLWRTWTLRTDTGDVDREIEVTARGLATTGLAAGCASSFYSDWLSGNNSVKWSGFRTKYAYDVRGNPVASWDKDGNGTAYVRDSVGRLVQTYGATYPSARVLDTAGRLVALGTTRSGTAWDPTFWDFDPATGLCTNKTYADGSAVARAYDAAGRPTRITLASGRWTECAYDAAGRLASETRSDGAAVLYSYDAFGRLVSATDGAGRAETFARDALGRATNETQSVWDELFWTNRTAVLDRPLDAFGRPAGLSLKIDGDFSQSICYDYGVDGHLSGMVLTNAQGRSVSVEYDWEQGRLAGCNVFDSSGAPIFARTQTRASRRPALVTACASGGTGPAADTRSFAYAYDAVGRPVSRNADAFAYNARGEVTDATIDSAAWSYAYDLIGNRTTASDSAGTTAYTANALNQYTAVDSWTPSYDLDGNLQGDGSLGYTWDAAGRLASARDPNAWRGDPWWSFEYDHRGRRVLKRNWIVLGGWSPPDGNAIYFYDGWNLIHEIRVTGSYQTTHIDYFWGPDLSGTLQGAGGVGGLVAVSIAGQFYFPGYDNNGNVVGYWDESGSLVAEYAYDAFGNTISSSGSMASVFPHRFSTKYYDAETDLYYYGYRYYSPSLGRWISRDPIGENGGMNLFASCKNKQVYSIDGLGWKILVFSAAYDNDSAGDAQKAEQLIMVGEQYVDKAVEFVRCAISDVQFRQYVNEDMIKFDGKPFKGTKQEYISQMNREKQSVYFPALVAEPLRLISRIKSFVSVMTESYDTIGVLVHGRMNLSPGSPDNPEQPRPFDDLEFVGRNGSWSMDRMRFFRLLTDELTNAKILCDLQVVSCYQDWDLLGLDESIPFEERDNAAKEHFEIEIPDMPNHETIHSVSDPLGSCPLDFKPFKFFRKYGPGED